MTDQPTNTGGVAPTTQVPAKRPDVRAGGQVTAIIPRTIDEVWRLAQFIAASGLAPKGMQRKEQIVVAIMFGAEVGLPPMQATQSIMVTNGRPSMWGDALLGVVQARGVDVEEWIEGEGDAMVAHCRITRASKKTERTFSVDQAKRAKLWAKPGPWQEYRERMLQMRARSWAIRDGCADIVRGIWFREEAVDADYEDVTASADAPVTVSQFLTADVAQADEGEIVILDGEPEAPATESAAPPTVTEGDTTYDAETGEVLEELNAGTVGGVEESAPPPEIEVKPQPSALQPTLRWVAQVRQAFEATQTKTHLEALDRRWNSDASLETRARLAQVDPAMARMLETEYATLVEQVKARGE